ncbi:glycosyltransferase [Pedomonas mirosovicensis]|uniref:glycosyltransferase n=1 Tax=Pedomonas mirosovicensis TaxID=2908641 RepID=UPI002166CBFC|nr:glycosyltransferase family 2 protein [Pedomonas mirosovicensis]MCH8685838.1 glycosyltransferase family 2 protein [Pedomonas mirosovicensis]
MPLLELTQTPEWAGYPKYSAVIGVPVHNEEHYIARSLRLLDHQIDPMDDFAIVLLLNNCTDSTLTVVRSLAQDLKHDVYVCDIPLPKNLAHAGMARKLAMDAAARLTEPHGIVLTTDADAVVADDWLAMTRKHVANGAEGVSGFVQHNPAEKNEWPQELKERTDLECTYENLLAELYSLLDPRPHNPWPNHMITLGASLAATREAYQKCGGVPPIPCGEDRAFIAALERIDARVQFPRDVVAYTSSRLAGRADGGMAATLKARANDPSLPCDPLLEPVALACKRAEWRRTLRDIWPAALPAAWAQTLKIAPARLRAAWAAPSFGQAWQCIEAASPELARQCLTMDTLREELQKLEALVARLRLQQIAQQNEVRPVANGQRVSPGYMDRAASVAAKAVAATAIAKPLAEPPAATAAGTTS